MPVPAFVAALFSSQAGTDAAEFYADMQRRVSRAKGVRLEWVTGSDITESPVVEVFIKPSYATRHEKDFAQMMDGKWLLRIDFGVVTHRRMKPDDLPQHPGFESLYENRKSLQVFGKVEGDPSGALLYLPYQENGRTERLVIDAKTLLPAGATLISDLKQAERMPVPSFRKPEAVLAQAQEALKLSLPLVIERLIWYGGQKKEDVILALPGGRAFVQPLPASSGLDQAVDYDGEAKTYRWTGSKTSVRLSSLGLRGLEPLWSGRTNFAPVEARLTTNFTAWAAGRQAWGIRAPGTRKKQAITVLYHDLSGLPAGYSVNEPGHPAKRVSYNFPLVGARLVP